MMSDRPGYSRAGVFLADQLTVLGDWRPQQWITLELAADDDALEPAGCALTSQEARDLAFGLLVLAEHADRRADGEEEVA
jgi:hypothetical protein